MKQSVTITGENLNVVVNNAGNVSVPVTDGARFVSKAEMRIAALKAKGVDTSCYFPLGTDQVIKIVDGSAIPVEMTDDVENKMVGGGYINHYTLFRRWVMSQMFHMLRSLEKDNANTLTGLIQDHGYEYQWRVIERELNAQAKMEKHGDTENFEARNRWFNRKTISLMAGLYVMRLQDYIEDNLMYRIDRRGNKVPKHTCKGQAYISLGGKNIFVSDLDKKVYTPLFMAQNKIMYSRDASELHAAVVKFNRLRKKMKREVKMDKFFIDAYKGSGAYFTCKNLIMFHGANFHGMGQSKSLKYLEDKANEYKDEGWRMIGVMKQLISDSGISISEKMSEWNK